LGKNEIEGVSPKGAHRSPADFQLRKNIFRGKNQPVLTTTPPKEKKTKLPTQARVGRGEGKKREGGQRGTRNATKVDKEMTKVGQIWEIFWNMPSRDGKNEFKTRWKLRIHLTMGVKSIEMKK
jgi:hypothetical protein